MASGSCQCSDTTTLGKWLIQKQKLERDRFNPTKQNKTNSITTENKKELTKIKSLKKEKHDSTNAVKKKRFNFFPQISKSIRFQKVQVNHLCLDWIKITGLLPKIEIYSKKKLIFLQNSLNQFHNTAKKLSLKGSGIWHFHKTLKKVQEILLLEFQKNYLYSAANQRKCQK